MSIFGVSDLFFNLASSAFSLIYTVIMVFICYTIAKSKGLYKGRKKIVNENFKNIYNDWKKGNLTAVKAIEMLDMKKSTFYRRVKEYESSK